MDTISRSTLLVQPALNSPLTRPMLLTRPWVRFCNKEFLVSGNLWNSSQRNWTRHKRMYSAHDRELLAMYKSIKHYRYTLEGRHFTIITNLLSMHLYRERDNAHLGSTIRWISYRSFLRISDTFPVKRMWPQIRCHG